MWPFRNHRRAARAAAPHEPEALVFKIEGYGPQLFWWRAEEHRLGRWGQRTLDPERFKENLRRRSYAPAAEEWAAFWSAVDRLGVWDWTDFAGDLLNADS